MRRLLAAGALGLLLGPCGVSWAPAQHDDTPSHQPYRPEVHCRDGACYALGAVE